MLIEIVPYVLGATISPVVLAVTVVLLAQKRQPLQQTLLFFLGGLTAAIPVGAVVFFAVHARAQTAQPNLSDSIIHLAIGSVLLWLAVRAWRKPPKKASRVSTKIHYGRDFVLGIALVMSDVTSLIMFIPAGLVLQSAPIDVRVAGLTLLIIALTMAIWLPLLLVLALGKRGKYILALANALMTKHGQQISGGMVGLIGLYELYKGMSGL